MDWSASNIVTVALGRIIYLWNAGTGTIEQLREYENGDHACSLAWIQEGNVLAIGSADGTVELWDAEVKKRYSRQSRRFFDGKLFQSFIVNWLLTQQVARDGWSFGSCWIAGMEFVYH